MNLLKIPTENELAVLSLDELNKRIRVAYYQLQEAIRMKENTTERMNIYHLYEIERSKRRLQLAR